MGALARKPQSDLEPTERIWTLRQLMAACRERVPEILRQIDTMFADPSMSSNDRIKLMDLVLDRGFGKPNQMVRVSEDRMGAAGPISPVRVYIPDNGRNRDGVGATIDAVTLEPVMEPTGAEAQQELELDDGPSDPLDEIESAEVIPWKK